MVKMHCTVCLGKFTAQRRSAKYCSEACKQRAKYKRDLGLDECDLVEDIGAICQKLEEFEKKYFSGEAYPDAVVATDTALSVWKHKIDKLQAKIFVIEQELDSYWYRCTECGQRAFGRVKTCDFCKGTKFERLHKA